MKMHPAGQEIGGFIFRLKAGEWGDLLMVKRSLWLL